MMTGKLPRRQRGPRSGPQRSRAAAAGEGPAQGKTATAPQGRAAQAGCDPVRHRQEG